jgi:hypothetical protein
MSLLIKSVSLQIVLFFLFGQLSLCYAQGKESNFANETYRQTLESEITPKESEEESANEIDYYYRYMPSRSVSSASGKVAITDTAAEYSYDLKAFGKLPVEFYIATRYIGIENTVNVPLPSHLTGVFFGVETTLPFFNLDKTYFRFGIKPSFYSDDWNFNSSAFSMPAHAFVIYQPDPKLTMIFGLAVFPGYENQVSPILGVIYKPNEKLSFNLVPERPNIIYALNKKLSVFIEGDFCSNEFKVSYPGKDNATLVYKEIHSGTGIQYKFNKFSRFSLSGGRVFQRALKYRDSLGKVVIKDGYYSQFSLEFDF